MNNSLPRRLQKIASLVDGKSICDVGCDHGKLSEYLLRENIVEKVIVSDISLPSLNKAIDLLSKFNYNFEYIHCDGLSGYRGKDVEQCIISGMGGDEIIKIIEKSPIQIKSYILSPQHNNISVKKYMLGHGYDIDYDIIILDKGKFYNIFRCRYSGKVQEMNEFDLYFGKANFDDIDSDIIEYVKNEKEKTKKILEKNHGNKAFLEYLELLEEFDKRK